MHAQCFYQPYPPRQVNNIYFDTFDLDSYLENMAGISSRTKLRLRWYGDINRICHPAFELKLKRNKLGWKSAERIKFDELTGNTTYEALRNSIYMQIGDEFENRFRQSDYPILINSYHRNYFESANRAVRITIDQNIRFFDQRVSDVPNIDYPSRTPEIAVLEVKTAAKNLNKARKVLGTIPLPASRSSKYVIGVQSILGY